MASKQAWKQRAFLAETDLEDCYEALAAVKGQIAGYEQENYWLKDRLGQERPLLEATSSPEIKADTEGAFKRGEQHARNNLGAWLYLEVNRFSRELQEALASEPEADGE